MIELKTIRDKKNNNMIYPFYVIVSPDGGLIKEEVNFLIENNVEEVYRDFNVEKLDGDKVTFMDIKNSCETMSLFGGSKIVLIFNANFLKNKDKKSDKLTQELQEYLKDLRKELIIVMYYITDTDREKPLAKLNKFPNSGAFVKLSKITGVSLNNKIEEVFKLKKGKIGKAEISYFSQRVENDIFSINNEVDKLVSYVDGNAVTKEDIDALLPIKVEEDIFALTNAILNKKTGMALSILSDLVGRGDKPSIILYMIEKQYKDILNVKLLFDEGKDSIYIGKQLNIYNNYIIEKLISNSRNYTRGQLVNMITSCLKTEKDIKSKGGDILSQIELMIINLGYIK